MSHASHGRRGHSYSSQEHPQKYSSAKSISGSSSSHIPKSKREPADYEDYLSSGKTQESFLESLKEPVLPGKKKDIEETIIFLHKGDERLFTSPNTLAKIYFDTEVNFPLIDNKDLKYFQSILIETGSVVFNHMNQNKHTGNISFSKAFIRKVIHITEWGLNPNKPLQLNFSHKNYNYWDYISAWKHAFYYQNRAEKHTWFIRLEPSLLAQELPYWFYNWFSFMGPEEDILPPDIFEKYENYISSNPKIRGVKVVKGSNLLRFFTTFSLPWIWQWSFAVKPTEIGTMTLCRQSYYKWWTKFDYKFSPRKNSRGY